MKTIIIIPTYDERENIQTLIESIFTLSISGVHVLVVDDNSPDGTARVVELLAKTNPQIHIIKRSKKQGLGSAYIKGFRWALEHSADLVFEIDADGSHNPEDIPRMIYEAEQGADVVIGSRRIQGGHITGWNLWRHLASWGAMTLARIMLGLKTLDVTAGFRCYQRRVLETLDLSQITSNGYAFQEEMVWLCEKNGFIIKEIPIIFKDREYGKSKLSRKDIVEFFVTIIRLKITTKIKQIIHKHTN